MVAATGDFSDYEPTTYDPGWILTVVVVALNFLISGTLPCLLWCHRRPKVDLASGQVRPAHHDTVSDSGLAMKKHNKPSDSNTPKNSGFGALCGYSSMYERSTIPHQIVKNALNVRAHKSKHNNPKMPKDVQLHVTEHRKGYASVDAQSTEEIFVIKADNNTINSQYFAPGDGNECSQYTKHTEGGKSMLDKLIDIANWDYEMKRIWSLAVPYSIQGIAYGVFSVIDVAIIGHFLGPMEANAYITVTMLIEFTTTFTYGFTEAVGTLCPQADGAGNPLLMGRYLQLGMIFYVIGTIPAVILWSFLTEEAVLWFGFDAQTAHVAQQYAYPYLIMELMEGMTANLLEYYNVTNHENYCTIFYLSSYTASTLSLACMAVLGWKDLVMVGIVQTFVSLILMAGNFAFGKYMGWLDDCWEGLVSTLSLRDRRAVHTMMVTAVPQGISWLLTYGEWEVMTIFAGFMGPAEVAAWGLLGYIWSCFEYLTEGLSSAADTRVAFRVGAGRPQMAKLCAYKGIYMGVVVSIFSSALLFTTASYLPGWITPDPTLQRMVFDLIPLIGFGQISMSIGSVCWSIIGAQGRMRLATVIEIFTSWFLVIPASAVLVFVFNFNLLGLCAALLISYSVGGVVTGFVVMTSDWDALAQRVNSYSAKDDVKYCDYDWEDIPAHIQRAAQLLGYDKKKWDNSGDTNTSNKCWTELTSCQQEAAKLLGYNKKEWDENNDIGDEGCDQTITDETHRHEDRNRDSKNGGRGGTCELHRDDMSWDQLPFAARKAAEILGIDKAMWDADEEPKSGEKHWDELTPVEQEAAKVLGYDETRWNADCDSGSNDD